MVRGSFTWFVTWPIVREFRLVGPVPKTVRLKRLNASARKSSLMLSVMGNDFARLMFSDLPQKPRTLGLYRVALPNPAADWTGNWFAGFRKRSLPGSNESPSN